MATLESLVDPMTKVQPLEGDFTFLEGPIWVKDRLYFSDIAASRRYTWSDALGLQLVGDNTNKANGQTLDAEGCLLVCEHATSVISRFSDPADPTTRHVVASHFADKELNSPNDVVVGPDGSIYFTDPIGGRTVELVGV